MCYTNLIEDNKKVRGFALTCTASLYTHLVMLLHNDRDAATLRYRCSVCLVQYARRHGPCPVRVTCVRAVCYRYALCGLKVSYHDHFIRQVIFHRETVWD